MPTYVKDPVRTSVGVNFTRPANTTAYAVGDAVTDSASATTPLAFAGIANKPGGSGVIKKAQVMTDQSANVGVYKLYLFSGSPASPPNDNAMMTLWANRALLIGDVTFAAVAVDVASQDTARNQKVDLNLPFQCANGQNTIWGILTTGTVFTPASAQGYRVELTAELDG